MISAEITAVAAGALAVFAVITAGLARQAMRRQGKAIKLVELDLQRQRKEIVLRLAEFSVARKPGETFSPASETPSEVVDLAHLMLPGWIRATLRKISSTRRRSAPTFGLGWPARTSRPTTRPAWPARGLAGAAAFLLPGTGRDRYAEEFRSELWDLAQSGAGRLQQLRYGFRQLCSALPMRLALRSPQRKNAAP